MPLVSTIDLSFRCPRIRPPLDAAAVVIPHENKTVTHGELEERSARLANAFLRNGLCHGDALAIMSENCAEYLEVAWAAHRAGLHLVPINVGLGAAEARYIIRDSGARCLVTTVALHEQILVEAGLALENVSLRICIDGYSDGMLSYDQLLKRSNTSGDVDQVQGALMLYSSGTTGHPKGIRRPLPEHKFGENWAVALLWRELFSFGSDVRYLSPAPLYHAAPLGFCLSVLWLGGTVVVMPKFEAVEMLECIGRYQITHTQVVPTHLIRLLRLPSDVRARYDLSSLKMVITAAAPCPPDVKDQVREWIGPLLYEYYGGSESIGLCAIGPDEVDSHRGSVGKSLLGKVRILRDDGSDCAPMEIGQIWFESPLKFEYHNDPEKTRSAWRDDRWSSQGDIGYLDEEDYLYLTDRLGDTIISGGVNIYPQEIENALIGHPYVLDVGIAGTGDSDLGEIVTAFVQLSPGVEVTAQTEERLRDFCKSTIARYKCPRQWVFVAELPRTASGKMLRRELRKSRTSPIASQRPGEL